VPDLLGDILPDHHAGQWGVPAGDSLGEGDDVGFDAVGRLLEAADHAQTGGLSTARGPEQSEELAGLDLQIDPVDRHELHELLPDVL